MTKIEERPLPRNDLHHTMLNLSLAGPLQVGITPFVTAGANQLLVVATNVLLSKVLGDPDPDYADLDNRYGPIRFPYPRGKERTKAPLPSGLLGPVRLIPLGQVVLRSQTGEGKGG